MESNQKIHCSVGSCKYNDITVQECKLKAINIMPNTNVNTGDEKETMCVSYKNNKERLVKIIIKDIAIR